MSNIFQRFMDVVNTGDQEKINDQFVHEMYFTRTLDEIKFMINNGADPRHLNDHAFISACCMNDVNIILYFINEHNVDINTHDGTALESAIYCSNVNNMKLLLEYGIIVTDRAIQEIITVNNSVEKLKILIDYVGQQRVAECILDKICKSFPEDYKNIVKNLIESGTDRDYFLDKLLKIQ